MSSSDSSTVIAHLYKSRQVLLELMQAQGYATDDYDGFSINEVSCMHKSQQMDMLLVEDTDKAIKKKTYIKYFCDSRQIKQADLQNMIDDLFLETEMTGQVVLKKKHGHVVGRHSRRAK